jgi:hypothetical protein
MANQITIDIVAETKKLTSGINDANGQIDGMSSKLKGAAAAAGAAASAFVLKQGVTFLKQGIDEAKEAAETMRAATTTFGEGSAALAKITEDADKFGKAIAVDNDVIIQLATQLGSRLPKDAKALSAEIVNLGFDIEAYTAGAVTADAVTGKLAKAFVDGELSSKELAKVFPDLEEATYAQAEAASKAGNNQKALDIIIEAAQKKYGDAAEKNVTSTQKFEVALANFKETLGTKVLPILEKGIDFLTKLISIFDGLPGPIQNVVLGLLAIVAIGGPLLGFLASAKTALITLGVVSEGAAVGTTLLNVALKAIPILAVIALIILLVKNWDTVVDVVKNVWETITEYLPKAWNKVKEFASKVIGFAVDIVQGYLALPSKMFEIGVNLVKGLWDGIANMANWLKDKVSDLFGNVTGWAKKALGIKSPSRVFAGIGKNIAQGLWRGLEKEKSFLKNNFTDFFGSVIPDLTLDTLNLPDFNQFVTTSQLIDEIQGSSVDQALLAGTGLYWDAANETFNIDDTVVTVAKLSDLMNSNYSVPSLNSSSSGAATYTITINAGLGTDPYALGREVSAALKKYGTVSANA